MRAFLCVLILTSSSFSLATEKEKGDEFVVRCTLGTDSRILAVVPKGEGCEVHYQKFGANKVIGHSQRQQEHCESLRGKVRKTLESAGFSCQTM